MARSPGGMRFNLKGADISTFTDLSERFGECVIPLPYYRADFSMLLKKENVKRGDLLISTKDHIVLSPLTGKMYPGEKASYHVIKADKDEQSFEGLKLLRHETYGQILKKLGLLSKGEADTVFVRLTQTEPFRAKDSFFINNFSDLINEAVDVVFEIFPEAEVKVIYTDNRATDVIKKRDKLEFFKIKDKYPLDNEKLILSSIEKKPVSDVTGEGSLFVPIEKLFVIRDFIKNKIVPSHTYLSVCGNIDNPAFIKVPLYSDLNSVVNVFFNTDNEWQKDYDVIMNGPFTGKRSFEAPYVTEDVESITLLYRNNPRKLWPFMRPGFKEESYSKSFLSSYLPFKKSIDAQIHGEKRACVSCGACEKICPSRVLPSVLFKHVEIDELEDAKRFRIMDCVDCGLCTYVCPSKISVAKIIASGKENIVREGI